MHHSSRHSIVAAVAAVQLTVAAGLASQAPLRPQAQSSVQQQLPTSAPGWTSQGDRDETQNLLVVGSGRSPSESQARQAAAAAAIDRGVLAVSRQLFADPSTATFYGMDALRQYLQKVSRTANSWTGNAGSQYNAYVQLQINKTFLRPSTVREYAASAPAPGKKAVGYLLVPVQDVSSATTRRTQVRLAKLRDGNFYFYFNIARIKTTLSVQLDRIQVLDDGSGGKTHWAFEITAAGNPMLKLPVAEYTDAVSTYRRYDKPYELQLRNEPVVEIRITGERGESKK